jgi:hypothetical protein
MAQIVQILALVATELNHSPYLVANPVDLFCVAGGDIHGVNLAGRDARTGNYQRWLGDGVETTWDEDTVVNLANAHDDAGALAAADALRVCIKVNGTLLNRVDSGGAAPAAGEFSCADDAGKMTVILGDAPAEGAVIEVFLAPETGNGAIVTTTLAALTPTQWPALQVVYAEEAVTATRLTR